MALEIFNPLKVGGIKPNISVVKNRNISFLSSPADTVELKSLDRFTSETAIQRMIENNPKISDIVKGFNPEFKLNMKKL